jgi:RNA polymerase-interacting CarD/CdnL/TRCF family regulator
MFKVGDKIINFNKVYRIFKITKQKKEGRQEQVISFRPYFQTKEKKSLTFSIPVANIDKTNIRKPVSKKELKRLLTELSKISKIKTPIDITKTRGELSLNNPNIHIQILKCLWKEKNDETTNFTKSKSEILGLAIKLLTEEVALVNGISLKKAEKKIKATLQRSH